MIVFQIIIAIFQVGLLVYQVIINAKTYSKDISDRIGYFEPTETNIPCAKEILDLNKNIYDLNNMIKFKNIGSDSLFVSETEVYINDELHSKNESADIFFGNEGRFNISVLNLDLKKHHFGLDKLNAEIIYSLKNSKGHKYKQHMKMTFKKVEDNRWELTNYNSLIK